MIDGAALDRGRQLTHEEDEIRHLRQQLVRFVIEQLKQSKADGTLQEPLVDLRQTLDADVRRSVNQALADSGFGKGAVRLDEVSIRAVTEQLDKIRDQEHAATAERKRLGAFDQPAGRMTPAERRVEVALPAGEGGTNSALTPAERPVGRRRSSQRNGGRFVDILFGMAAPLLAKIVLALASVVIALLFYIAWDKLGDGAEPDGSAPVVAAGAMPLPANSNPFEAEKEPKKGNGTPPPFTTPTADTTSDMPGGR